MNCVHNSSVFCIVLVTRGLPSRTLSRSDQLETPKYSRHRNLGAAGQIRSTRSNSSPPLHARDTIYNVDSLQCGTDFCRLL